MEKRPWHLYKVAGTRLYTKCSSSYFVFLSEIERKVIGFEWGWGRDIGFNERKGSMKSYWLEWKNKWARKIS